MLNIKNDASLSFFFFLNASLRYITEQWDHFSQTQICLFFLKEKIDELDLRGSLRLGHISRVT